VEFAFHASVDSYAAPVFVRLGHVLLIVALLAATGGHWALLQTMAWTNMLADNLRTGSVGEALAKTFDGKHPCSLCKQICAGKKSEKKVEFPTLAKKLEFVSDRAGFVLTAPEVSPLRWESKSAFAALIQPPPVPPPRQLPG
jgi:hypothetical protein